MIIQNGYIENMILNDGGIDPETGRHVAGTVAWSDPVPCQYFMKSNRQAVLANGERVETVAYQILVEEPYCPCAEQVRITDMFGNIAGVYVVETVEPLDAVSEVRITVKPLRDGNQEEL